MSEPKFIAPFPPTVVPQPKPSSFPSWLSPVGSVLDTFHAARARLNLSEPGKAEDLSREVRMTHLTNFTFDGARADLAKTFSQFPAFQVTHAFTAGSQGGSMGGANPGTYAFTAVYANAKSLLQGNVDNEGSLSGRFNHAWNSADTSKVQIQLPSSAGAESMIALEHDRVGKDYTLNLKTYNPSLVDFTGTYMATYLQSVTSHLALGVETLYQRPQPEIEDCQLGYIAKWHDIKKDEQGQPGKDSWIATAQILAQGTCTASYWKKLGDRVDAAVDIMMLPSLIPTERKAIATAGIKYDFRQQTFRGQVDSTGKVAALLEHRLTPTFSFLVAGELDHMKSTCKMGVGIQIESADETVMEQANAAAASGAPPM